jgi:hypothetical protein
MSLYDRNGNLRTPQDIYMSYDPGVDVAPTVEKVFPLDRNVLDGYKPELTAYYVNWQGTAFENRLTFMAGYRTEESTSTGQWLTPNAPWFSFPELGEPAGIQPEKYPPEVWGYSESYALSNFESRSGDSYNFGLSWKINESNNIYVTYSKTFKLNFGFASGFLGLQPESSLVVADALEWAKYQGNNSYTANGATISSVDQGEEYFQSNGYWANIPNEEGFNYEIGWKTSMNDDKLVGTWSIFQGVRRNQKLDDGVKQQNVNENYNYSSDANNSLFSPGPTEAYPDAPPKSAYYNTRVFRWRQVGFENTITGTELEFIYTPIPNYQAVVSGAYLWQAETTDHPTYKSVNDSQAAALFLGQRIENVPEIRFNIWNKYTFTETALRGLSLGAGMRYSSSTVVGRTVDYDPATGGFQAGDYLIFDANVSYPWSVAGLNFVNTLQVTNLFDEVYYEGSFVGADRRTWRLYTTLEF